MRPWWVDLAHCNVEKKCKGVAGSGLVVRQRPRRCVGSLEDVPHLPCLGFQFFELLSFCCSGPLPGVGETLSLLCCSEPCLCKLVSPVGLISFLIGPTVY